MTPTLHLIDGHSQVFRAYHAIRGGLSTASGVPTNAVFGFLMGLNVLLKTEKPSHLIVVFDAGHDARSQMYPAYKSNREETPEDLAEQIEWIRKVLRAMGVTQAQSEREEADDVIASLTRQARAEGFDVKIITNDKDMFQLVDDHVTVLRTPPRSGLLVVDGEAVREKMGVGPEQIVDLLGLMGDSVDCIPGVPGVGQKTAAKLLAEHGDLEGVLAAAESVKQPRLRASLIENAEKARLSRRLATLDREVDVPFDPKVCAFSLTPTKELTDLLRELEINTLVEEWGSGGAEAETKCDLIADVDALRRFVKRARNAPLLSFDTETTSLDAMRADLVGISMAIESGHAVYIPIGHVSLNGRLPDQMELETVRDELGPLMADPKVLKCGQHLKYDLKIMRRAGFEVNGLEFDTLLASQCLNPDKRGHGLKDLALNRLGVQQTRIEEVIGDGKNQISFAEVAIEDAAAYAAQDADLTLRLAEDLRAELESAGLLPLYMNIEMPLVEVLADMEMAGVAVDTAHFDALRQELQSQLVACRKEIHDIAGRPFNISSTPQLREILFDELKLPVLKRGKTGASTDVGVLETLAKDHPLPAKILEHRSLEKLLSTYVEPLPALVNPETKRIHTHYHQIGAATGRLSSSEPNLQNIPVRTEMGRRIREGFRPRAKENVFLAADYSQIELRIAAHLTGDPGLIEAFEQGEDIHRATAARVHGISSDAVTKEQREAAKRVSFGILYGISAHRLSNDLGISRAEGQEMIDQYFKTFAGVKTWIDRTLEEARERGHVTTLTGRRRHIPDIQSRNFNLRMAAERVAVNAPVQGSAADLIKIAMRRIAEHIAQSDLEARMILQVHDELIFDLPKREVDTLRPAVIDLMAGAMDLRVPVVVDVNIGETWADC